MRTRNKVQEPKVLKAKDIPALAQYIKSNECKNIALMLGAGVSTAAGIPDFRSPETGLYSNLARLNLPYPEAVFDISFFRKNPVPFYSLAHELYPGKFRPTLTHSFVRLLADKGLLLKCWTQNIDTLERRAGVPDALIVEAQGSFATQRCVDCHTEYDGERMKAHVLEQKIARCDKCKGLVKPDIVFFGEALPEEFISSIPALSTATLLIIMGTSLTVHPFASLASLVPADTCPRVLINMDAVGDIGSRPDDVCLLGRCDEVVRELCRELGWEAELDRLWAKTVYTVEGEYQEGDGEEDQEETEEEKVEKEEAALKAEVDALADAVEAGLKINLADVDVDAPSETKEGLPEPKASSPASSSSTKHAPSRDTDAPKPSSSSKPTAKATEKLEK